MMAIYDCVRGSVVLCLLVPLCLLPLSPPACLRLPPPLDLLRRTHRRGIGEQRRLAAVRSRLRLGRGGRRLSLFSVAPTTRRHDRKPRLVRGRGTGRVQGAGTTIRRWRAKV
eukprot:scaffold4046_cov39-Phaeocystis_antarctica.AAC.1